MDMPAGSRSAAESDAISGQAPLLAVDSLTVDYPIGRRKSIRAVGGVSFVIDKGDTLGLVGESGCGKTSVARAIANLHPAAGGRIWFRQRRLHNGKDRRVSPDIQMVFQNAVSSLNPCRSVGKSVAEPLRSSRNRRRRDRFRLAARMMEDVGIDPSRYFHRRPYELSVGQCQRISIARALVTSPALLICDEPVSSLDVSVQAQILNLLRTLRERHGLTLLFISHDLAVIKNMSHRVAVMYAGTLCEMAPSAPFYRRPLHPYSAALLAAAGHPAPHLTPRQQAPAAAPSTAFAGRAVGCSFRPRCPAARSRCADQPPALRHVSLHRQVACHYPLHRHGAP